MPARELCNCVLCLWGGACQGLNLQFPDSSMKSTASALTQLLNLLFGCPFDCPTSFFSTTCDALSVVLWFQVSSFRVCRSSHLHPPHPPMIVMPNLECINPGSLSIVAKPGSQVLLFQCQGSQVESFCLKSWDSVTGKLGK